MRGTTWTKFFAPLKATGVALSAALCMLVVVAWARSFYVHDTLVFRQDGSGFQWVESQCGRLLVLGDLSGGKPDPLHPQWLSDRLTAGSTWADALVVPPPNMDPRLGFVFQHYDAAFRVPFVGGDPAPRPVRLIVVPYWSLAVASGLPPGLRALSRLRRWRRRAAGCCLACGYDLRATPGRCPECGRPATTPEAA